MSKICTKSFTLTGYSPSDIQKSEKDLKSAEMTTNKCVVYGKVTETNLVQRNSNILREKNKGNDEKKMQCSKRQF